MMEHVMAEEQLDRVFQESFSAAEGGESFRFT